jgi:hypothetical protein
VKWVTWEQVGVDLRRFVDPAAEFLFVPAGSQPLPANAQPFDIPGARLSHRRGHSTFHTIVQEYGLTDPLLDRIARMVDEADTTQEVNVEPAAPGLDLICDGIRTISVDDRQAVERGALIYDALYAQLAAGRAGPSGGPPG